MPAVLVTGASTGIGATTAVHLAQLGHLVFAGVRREGDGERVVANAGDVAGRIVPVLVDVTDLGSIDAAVATVRSVSGTTRFAGLVNNAGVARGGPTEYLEIAEWRDQLEVNVIGQVAATKAFLPLVREGCGRVVFVGSISGRVGQALLGPYSASKFAIEGLAESLRHELFPFGLHVSVIEPGAVNTPIWGKAGETSARLAADAEPLMLERYGEQIAALDAAIAHNDGGGVAPVKVARAIEHALFASNPKPRYLVGPDARAAALATRLLPDRLKDTVIRTLG
jgi:NAD(P)-dependent dehydrogenase (short-subunit alcohol dehydrogenase family)